MPNFSEGRDAAVVSDIVSAMRTAGAHVLDWSADADHHRSVVTIVGPPDVVEEAAFAAARVAIERIDLRRHAGVHPRVGALDVLPFVPIAGLTLDDARTSARRVGARIADELGVPVFFYGAASDPPGRVLSELRAGGFEMLQQGWPTDRGPDLEPRHASRSGVHPSAGVTCVGARRLLLAWNVYVDGIDFATARRIAARIRQSGGGLPGVRALALQLPGADRMQISINLEDVELTSPMEVFRRIEDAVLEQHGRIDETEVIGMLPDQLVWSAAADRLKLAPDTARRLLSQRLVEVLTRHEPSLQDT